MPKWSDLGALLQFPSVGLAHIERRLSRDSTIDGLCESAKKTTLRAILNDTDGAAEEENTMARCRQAFRNLEFAPFVFRDASSPDPTTYVFGRPIAFPVVLHLLVARA